MVVLSVILNPAMLGVLALFLSIVWMLRDEKDRTRPLLVLAVVINLFYGVLLNLTMSREGALFPWKYDHVLYCLDESLGLHAAVVARALQGHWHIALWVIYQAMVPMMIVWFLVTRYRGWRGSVVLAYVAELIFGPLLYTIVPACGPLYAFGKQWLHPPQVPAGAIRLAGMPNAFPSLHVATAFVFVFFAPNKLWKAVALAFLAATVLATLSTGEHYVIDLVPGLAFGCFAACVGLRRIRWAVGFIAIALAWSIGVRLAYGFFIAHPALVLACLLLTVAAAIAALLVEWHTAAGQRPVAEPPAVALPG